jgi:beta-glucuronidase
MKKLIILIIIIAVVLGGAAWGFHKTISDSMPVPQFRLYDPGQRIVHYEKYGEFINDGEPAYKYKITDRPGLAAAVGEGIYPNTQVYKDPVYKEYNKEGRLQGDRWGFIGIDDTKLAFYKWASLTDENPGVREFYAALLLENADMTGQSIKGFHSVIVNYPKTISFTYWNTPWCPAQTCITNIAYLTRRYPFLGVKLSGADIKIENGYDLDPSNDIFYIKPGRVVACKPRELLEFQNGARLKNITKSIGKPDARLVQYDSGDWQFIVKGKPFMVKAVAYAPTKLGQSPDEGTLTDWTRSDAMYKAWVDKNRNNRRDPDEKEVGDFQLLKDMGANTLRIYDHEQNSNKEMFRKMHEKHGFMLIMGDLLGTYAVGSGVSWYRGTNYDDPIQREMLKARVRKMVEAYKDEPYVLMWMLGNETNYGVANSAKRFPRPFYKFVNEIAKMIKEIDPHHPVAVCNGDLLYLDIFSALCPDVDILGTNSYRGWHGFGFWKDVKRACNKPVIITEYGAPAYWDAHTESEAERAQAEYHIGAWSDIKYNSAGYGSGNALGGVVFEWIDEWWKAYEPSLHDTHKQWPGPVKGGWFYEEWLGLTSQGDGKSSPYLRQLRKGYFAYKTMWNPNICDKLWDLWYTIVVYLAW